MPGPTDINKMHFHAATSQGNTDNCPNWFCANYPINVTTIYDSLDKDGLSWEMHWMDWNEAMAISPLNQRKDKYVHDLKMNNFFDQLENKNGQKLSNYTFLIPR